MWLHLGSLLPVLIVYRAELAALVRALAGRDGGRGRHALGALVLASLPAAIAGLVARQALEAAFASPRVAALGLVGTTLALVSLRFAPPYAHGPGHGPPDPGPLPSALVGCAQALALVPGLSRSGTTIAAARWLGLGPAAAAAFSFLLSIPAVLGAALLEGVGHGGAGVGAAPALAGLAAAALSGYAALWAVRRLIDRGRLDLFAPYTLALALAILWRL